MPDRGEDSRSEGGIVITGVAATASLGIDAESIWLGMLAGKCGIGPMSEVESALPAGSWGGQASALPPGYCPGLPREARYLRWTVEHALRDAGLQTDAPYEAARKCAIFGTTLHGIRAGGRFLRSGDTAELRTFLASATSRLALERLGLEGGAITTCSACSSSLGAIALGATLLESGQADAVVAGGYDAISEYSWGGFNALRLIAKGPLRPFCRDREGMKVAEGYGILVLERAESAARRGARPRARLAGWGESADAHHLTQPHPQGEGALAAMRQALGRARVNADELGMIAAHATGTIDNDGAEYQALSRLLGDKLPRVPVVAFKGFLGHTLGGAGAVELVMTCMAMRDGRVPACPNVEAADIQYGLNLQIGTAAVRDVTCTLNTSLGFGGANTCMVLTEPRGPVAHRNAGSPHSLPRKFDQEAWVTGVGIVLPGAVGHAAFVGRLLRLQASNGHERVETLDDESIGEYLNARRARRLSAYVKFTLAAATMAMRDAGLTERSDAMAGAAAILGSMHGSADFCVEYYTQIVKDGALAANPVLFAEGVPNAAAAHLSASLGLRGACQTIIGSRTAGLDALALGAMRVRSGAADVVMVVAAEAPCDVVDRAYEACGLQARVSGDRADGFRRSFGGIAMVVESRRSAAARGAAPYARVLGSEWASSSAGDGDVPASCVSSVASVVSRLRVPGRLIGSACGTWIDRAEELGMRRVGVEGEGGSVSNCFGELFSATPLAALAVELIGGPSGSCLSVLCTDWSGGATGVTIERLDRRIGAK